MVVSVENQKHGTYLKLQNKSKFYRQLSQFLVFSLVAQISLTQNLEILKPISQLSIMEISKLQVMAIAQLLVSQGGGSVSSSLTKLKSKSSINSSTLRLPHLISPNFLGFQAQSTRRSFCLIRLDSSMEANSMHFHVLFINFSVWFLGKFQGEYLNSPSLPLSPQIPKVPSLSLPLPVYMPIYRFLYLSQMALCFVSESTTN